MKSHDQEIQAITRKISEQQDAILREWEQKMMEVEERGPVLAAMSREEFRNSIPDFLGRLCDSLRGEEVDFTDIGEVHGAHRWEYGMSLHNTIREWGLLHNVLAGTLNSSREELSAATLARVHEELTAHIQEGIIYSVKEFDKLRQDEAKAQLSDLEEALEERGETRDQNLRGTSHDLKGIMKNIQMGLFLIEDEEMSPKAKELVEQMSTAADSLEQLLNDLLDLFRLETNREEMEVSEFDAAAVLHGLCKSMQPMAKTEKLELKCSGDDSLPVKTDPKKIERVARNLLLNALKYTREGHVSVEWEGISDGHWQLQISDTGPGLDATHAESLTTEAESSETVEYEKKASANREEAPPEVQSHGEGIGLLIVRHLCKLLDAAIRVKTGPGKGTEFTIVFPKSLDA